MFDPDGGCVTQPDEMLSVEQPWWLFCPCMKARAAPRWLWCWQAGGDLICQLGSGWSGESRLWARVRGRLQGGDPEPEQVRLQPAALQLHLRPQREVGAEQAKNCEVRANRLVAGGLDVSASAQPPPRRARCGSSHSHLQLGRRRWR